jgi:hypothetical protein
MARLESVDFSRESYPYLIYNKIGFIYSAMDLTIPLDYGYNYMVHRINARWSSQSGAVPGTYASPLLLEIFKDAGRTALQLHPISLQLATSPAESGVSVDLVNPGRPMTARQMDFSVAQNILFRFRDVIYLRVSNITAITIPGNPDGSLPSYLDFLIIGRYYPEKSLVGWRN